MTSLLQQLIDIINPVTGKVTQEETEASMDPKSILSLDLAPTPMNALTVFGIKTITELKAEIVTKGGLKHINGIGNVFERAVARAMLPEHQEWLEEEGRFLQRMKDWQVEQRRKRDADPGQFHGAEGAEARHQQAKTTVVVPYLKFKWGNQWVYRPLETGKGPEIRTFLDSVKAALDAGSINTTTYNAVRASTRAVWLRVAK